MNAARIAIVGLGNLMRTDDAVGMLALERLKVGLQVPRGVQLIEGGTLGLDLIYALHGITHVVAIDAVDAGVEPGTILRYSGEGIAEMPVSKSVHLLGFSDLIGAMRLTGDAPEHIVVLGVQAHTIAWGTELTRPVERALPRLIDAALHQVSEWAREIAEDKSIETAMQWELTAEASAG